MGLRSGLGNTSHLLDVEESIGVASQPDGGGRHGGGWAVDEDPSKEWGTGNNGHDDNSKRVMRRSPRAWYTCDHTSALSCRTSLHLATSCNISNHIT